MDILKTQFKYIALMFIFLCVTIIVIILSKLFSSARELKETHDPQIIKDLQKTLHKTEEDFYIKKATVISKSETEKQKLEEILGIEDGVQRRIQLSELINRHK